MGDDDEAEARRGPLSMTHSLFVALWIFFGFTALVICGVIFLIARSSARKEGPRTKDLGTDQAPRTKD